MIYAVAVAFAPVMGWLYTTMCRLTTPRARLISRPRPLHLFRTGGHTPQGIARRQKKDAEQAGVRVLEPTQIIPALEVASA